MTADYCRSCGQAFSRDVQFCPNCGTAVSGAADDGGSSDTAHDSSTATAGGSDSADGDDTWSWGESDAASDGPGRSAEREWVRGSGDHWSEGDEDDDATDDTPPRRRGRATREASEARSQSAESGESSGTAGSDAGSGTAGSDAGSGTAGSDAGSSGSTGSDGGGTAGGSRSDHHTASGNSKTASSTRDRDRSGAREIIDPVEAGETGEASGPDRMRSEADSGPGGSGGSLADSIGAYTPGRMVVALAVVAFFVLLSVDVLAVTYLVSFAESPLVVISPLFLLVGALNLVFFGGVLTYALFRVDV